MMGNVQENKIVNDYQRQSEQYWSQAEKFVEEGHYLEAALLYERSAATEKLTLQPHLENVVEDLNIAGYCYYQICQYRKALKLYEQAMKLARNLGWNAYIAPILRNVGGV